MKKMRYTALSILALSAFLLTACGNKSEEAVSSSPPSSSQVASTSSSSSTISSKPSASKQVTGSSQSRVASAVSSSQDTVASFEASSAVETSSSPAAVTEASPAPVAQGAVAPDQPASVADANQSAPEVSQPAEMVNHQPVSPGAATGQWGGMTINGDGTVVMGDMPYVITSVTPGESGILYMNAMQDHPMGTGLYYHYYPAGVAIPFENFEDPTDISRDRLIVGTGDYIDYPAELQDQMMTWLDVIYR